MRTYESFFNTKTKKANSKKTSSAAALYNLGKWAERNKIQAPSDLSENHNYYVYLDLTQIKKSKWTTATIIIWSMCLGALIVYLVSCL